MNDKITYILVAKKILETDILMTEFILLFFSIYYTEKHRYV